MNVTLLHKDVGAQLIQFDAAVVTQDTKVAEFYHYRAFYLEMDGAPFRTIKLADFHMVLSGGSR